MRPKTTRDLSDPHEKYLASLLGGRRTVNSGALPNDPGDGRNQRYTPFAFCWDGKATKKASASVSLSTWDKLVEQSSGQRPLLALRYYGELLTVTRDLAVVDLNDFAELLDTARRAI